MASENNIFLCVLFSVLNGLFLSCGSALPAWFAAKDREVDKGKSEVRSEVLRVDERKEEIEESLEVDKTEYQQDHFVEEYIADVIDAMIHENDVDEVKEKTSPW